MKKVFAILQWAFGCILALSALVNGFNFGSLLIIISAILMMPIPPIRKLLNENKIKNWIIITISIVLFFFGVIASPSTETATDDTTDSSLISSTVSEETSSEKIISSVESSSSDNESKSTTSSKTNSSSVNSVGNGTATAVKPSNISTYSGEPYITVNGNVPSFSSAELTTKAYEKYSDLDSLGRCGVAIASCGKEIMPADGEERGSISSIKPSGWVQAQYDNVSGKYLYNRCHLIGWQLSAENANKKNLITGTKYMNTKGMLPFENMVADYIQETGNHVAYRITPIYEGNNLLASGVQMEAYSIEDKGEGICFNVYVYNVQPDISINYATGESTGPSSSSSTPVSNPSTTTPSVAPATPSSEESATTPTGQTVYRTPKGKRYHLDPDCGGKNSYSTTLDQATSAGLTPCQKCAE